MQMTVQHLDRKQHISNCFKSNLYAPPCITTIHMPDVCVFNCVFFSTDKDKSLIFNLELQILLSERNRHDCTHLWLTIEKWNGPQLNDDSWKSDLFCGWVPKVYDRFGKLIDQLNKDLNIQKGLLIQLVFYLKRSGKKKKSLPLNCDEQFYIKSSVCAEFKVACHSICYCLAPKPTVFCAVVRWTVEPGGGKLTLFNDNLPKENF